MHGYAGNPSNYPAVIDLGDDSSDPPTFLTWNIGFEGLADRTAFLNRLPLLNAVFNWNPTRSNPAGGTSNNLQFGFAYHAFSSQWLGIFATATNLVTMATADGGQTWLESNPDFVNFYLPMFGQPLACNPTTGDVVCLRYDSVGAIPYVSHKPALASAWVDLSQAGVLPVGGVGTVFFAPFSGGSGTFIFVGAASSGGTGFGAFSLTATGSGSWSSFTLPSGWSTVTGNIAGYLSAVNAAGTGAIVALCGLTPGSGTDRSRLLSLTSGAPVDVTPSFLTSGVEQLRGVCYGPTDLLWGAITTDSSGASHVYTSPDLVTWTPVSSFANTVAAGIAVAGNVWAIYVFQTAVPHTNRVLVCGAIGAATPVWTPADFTDVNQISSRTTVLGAFASSGQQLLAAEIDNTTLSLASVRISQRGVGA